MSIVASAPGKLVLSGEYAVLDGAPAIAMAVNRRARVTVSASAVGCHTVAAPGFAETTGRFTDVDGGFQWLADGDEFGLLEHVWRAARANVQGHIAIELDSRAFKDADSGIKFGIGSSAALSVALALALHEAGATKADPTSIALQGHRQFQQGLGSGVDVACSSLGGLIEYSIGTVPGRRLTWPERLEAAVFWVGVPVSTGERLARLKQQAARPSRAALVLASRRLAAAWGGGAAEAILDEYRDYTNVLREFSVDHDLGIFEAGHAELAEAAGNAGVIYKPCGAGGGDTGICLATDRAALDAFINSVEAAGSYCPDMGIDSRGAQVEGEEH